MPVAGPNGGCGAADPRALEAAVAAAGPGADLDQATTRITDHAREQCGFDPATIVGDEMTSSASDHTDGAEDTEFNCMVDVDNGGYFIHIVLEQASSEGPPACETAAALAAAAVSSADPDRGG